MCRSTRFRDLVDDIAIQHSVHRQQGRFLQQRGVPPYGLEGARAACRSPAKTLAWSVKRLEMVRLTPNG
jgi:hypothetical protein